MDKPKGSILIVDDEESIRNPISRKLQSEGYDCMAASNGEEALEAVSRQEFDMMLLDIKMPGISGMDVLSHMANDHPDTCVIMTTAVADAQTAVDAMKQGAYDYVIKPFSLEALSMRVERALERKRLIQENKDYRLRLTENALQARTYDLDKRVKELSCLYGISDLAGKPDISLEEVLQGTVDLIRPAWQYPEITCARVILDGQEFATENCGESAWQQASDIIVHGEQAGVVQACYLEERPEADEGPFLKEERDLLDAIAERLERTIERHRAEEALRESEEQHSLLVGNIADAVFRFKEGVISWGNDKMREMLGYNKSEMIGVDVNLFVSDNTTLSEVYKEVDAGLKTEGHFHGTTRVKKKDGSIIDIEYTASQVPGKDPIEIVGVARDITERRQAEETLRESEERFRQIFNGVNDEIIYIDTNGVILNVNEKTWDIFGYRPHEVIGRNVLELDLFDPDELSKLSELMMASKEQGGIQRTLMEMEARHRDGHMVPMEASTGLVAAADGTPEGYISRIRDITERKQAEEALRKAHGELELRVEERTADLAKTNEELQASAEQLKRRNREIAEARKQLETLNERLEVRWTPSLGQYRDDVKSGSRCPPSTWY